MENNNLCKLSFIWSIKKKKKRNKDVKTIVVEKRINLRIKTL